MDHRKEHACVCQKGKADTVPSALYCTDCHFVAFTATFEVLSASIEFSLTI